MNKQIHLLTTLSLALVLSCSVAQSQTTDTSAWTLEKCINYALQQNIQVRKTSLTNDANEAYLKQSKASRLPSVSASVGQNFSWEKAVDANGNYSSYDGSNNTSYELSSSVTLFNGFKISNSIKQSELNLQAGKYDALTTQESISLQILNAYLQVLYAEEQVKNYEKQVESTQEQLRLANERLTLGSIAKSDYLQVKSQLATEKLSLANAQNNVAIYKVNLMQLLELPVNNSFTIYHPDMSKYATSERNLNADSIYLEALNIKPQIKSAQLTKESTALDVKIAQAGYMPRLSLGAGVGTGYSSLAVNPYATQVQNKITPTIGLTLTIPIYQNRQVKTNVEVARINTSKAELDEMSVRNTLRKSIEQACVDVSSAEKEFVASTEQFNASEESYLVAAEKYEQGVINSVDFLIQKTNLISAESELLQSKYKLIFNNKILDFYSGKSIIIN